MIQVMNVASRSSVWPAPGHTRRRGAADWAAGRYPAVGARCAQFVGLRPRGRAHAAAPTRRARRTLYCADYRSHHRLTVDRLFLLPPDDRSLPDGRWVVYGSERESRYLGWSAGSRRAHTRLYI